MINEAFPKASRWRQTELNLAYGRRYRQTPRRSRNPVLDWALTLLFFGLLVFGIVRFGQMDTRRHEGAAIINDGDTLTLAGQRIRLEGIDAPEYNQTCTRATGAWPCGRDARKALAAMAAKGAVRCSGWQNDKYGRLLGSCTVGATDINRAMVASGWAVSYGSYLAEEVAARKAALGIWQGEFIRPAEWRRTHERLAAADDAPHDFWYKLLAFLRDMVGFE